MNTHIKIVLHNNKSDHKHPRTRNKSWQKLAFYAAGSLYTTFADLDDWPNVMKFENTIMNFSFGDSIIIKSHFVAGARIRRTGQRMGINRHRQRWRPWWRQHQHQTVSKWPRNNNNNTEAEAKMSTSCLFTRCFSFSWFSVFFSIPLFYLKVPDVGIFRLNFGGVFVVRQKFTYSTLISSFHVVCGRLFSHREHEEYILLEFAH